MTEQLPSSKLCSSEESVPRLRLTSRLNDSIPGITSCAWPGCTDRKIRGGTLSDGREVLGLRVGILCLDHAKLVAEAVFEDQVWAARFYQAFSQKQEPVDLRGVDRLRRENDQARIEEEQKAGEPGFVYYLQVGERVKIGFSTNIRRRLRAYPPESKLLAIEPGCPDVERRRHRQFEGSRTHGREWFCPTADLMEHVAELDREHGPASRYAHHYRKNENPIRVHRTS